MQITLPANHPSRLRSNTRTGSSAGIAPLWATPAHELHRHSPPPNNNMTDLISLDSEPIEYPILPTQPMSMFIEWFCRQTMGGAMAILAHVLRGVFK